MFDTIYTSKGEAILVSPEDWRELAQYCWCVSVKGYAVRGEGPRMSRKCIYMHRVVTHASPREVIDHVNMTRLDNRRENLRRASRSQNAANCEIRATNTSGVKGVSPERSRWLASITVDYRQKRLGVYATIAEAAEVRKLWEQLIYGEFAR